MPTNIQASDSNGDTYRIHRPTYRRSGPYCAADLERWPCTVVRLAESVVEDALGPDVPVSSLWFLKRDRPAGLQ